MRSRASSLAFVACIIAAPFGSAQAQGVRIPDDCREVISTPVQVRLKADGRSEAQLKSALRQLASLEAVQQVNGVIVRSRSEIAMSSERSAGKTDSASAFQQRIKAQASGLVALTVTDESYDAERAFLKGDARVCIPKDMSSLKDPVYIGTFLSSRGEDLAEGRKIVETVLSSSRSFIAVNDEEDGEWIVRGQIDSVDVHAYEVREAAAGNPLLGIGDKADPGARQRIHVKGSIKASNRDGDLIVQGFDDFRVIAGDRDANDAIELWTPQLIRDAARKLQDAIVARRSGRLSDPAPKAQSPQSPKW